MNISNRIFEEIIIKTEHSTFVGFKIVWDLGIESYTRDFLNSLEDEHVCGYLFHIESNIFYIWNRLEQIERKVLQKLKEMVISINIVDQVPDRFYAMETSETIPVFTISNEDLMMLRLMS